MRKFAYLQKHILQQIEVMEFELLGRLSWRRQLSVDMLVSLVTVTLVCCWMHVQLAAKCDVVVENYMPGKLSEYGLGYDQLRQINPAIIYASLSGQSSVCSSEQNKSVLNLLHRLST